MINYFKFYYITSESSCTKQLIKSSFNKISRIIYQLQAICNNIKGVQELYHLHLIQENIIIFLLCEKYIIDVNKYHKWLDKCDTIHNQYYEKSRDLWKRINAIHSLKLYTKIINYLQNSYKNNIKTIRYMNTLLPIKKSKSNVLYSNWRRKNQPHTHLEESIIIDNTISIDTDNISQNTNVLIPQWSFLYDESINLPNYLHAASILNKQINTNGYVRRIDEEQYKFMNRCIILYNQMIYICIIKHYDEFNKFLYNSSKNCNIKD